MVSGFLGTVIAVERAVAINRRWMYLGPLCTGLGSLALIAGVGGMTGPLLFTLGSLGLGLVFVYIVRAHPALFSITMAVGAWLWLAGNVLWLAGWPVYRTAYWWAGFLALTIAGERLELNRVLRLTRPIQMAFAAAAGLFLAGLVVLAFNHTAGARLAGLGMAALAAWLLWYDIARFTVKKTGLTRFIAVCLLAGYVWLAIGGLLAVAFGGVTAGPYYDAILHSLFVGFVMSMIFGHAPIIFPAVAGRAIPFSNQFYSHLGLLHLSLALRLAGDLAGLLPLRQWGGLLNVAAILLFVANTARAARRSVK
ncbi:MAG: hypothetical protein ACE5G8_00880, partial [Anaerolineae bacterium]